ncbi:MAG: hypothetical protein Q8876_05180 [Bacillota bacterium]|nr:hypothetical protein [Bacillota bacterium]
MNNKIKYNILYYISKAERVGMAMSYKRMRNLLILMLICYIIATLFFVIAFLFDDSSTSIHTVIPFLNVVLFWVYFIFILRYYRQPTTPVGYLLTNLTKKRITEAKIRKYCQGYVVPGFEESEKFEDLIKLRPAKIKSIKTIDKSDGFARIIAEFADGEKYQFEVVTLLKKRSGLPWRISNYCKIS